MDHSKEFEQLVNEARARVSEISIDDMRALAAPFRLIDVREDGEWATGHLPNAEHIGKGVIERDIVAKVPNKAENLVLYCGGGYRSVLAADAIQKMGYRAARSLIGGWREWNARKLPTTK